MSLAEEGYLVAEPNPGEDRRARVAAARRRSLDTTVAQRAWAGGLWAAGGVALVAGLTTLALALGLTGAGLLAVSLLTIAAWCLFTGWALGRR
jgi:hypothetical protein